MDLTVAITEESEIDEDLLNSWKVRTLSVTDDSLLPIALLKRFERNGSVNHRGGGIILEEEEEEEAAAIARRRANTTNTLYLDSTIARPDKDALLKCMSVQIYQHMQEAAHIGIIPVKTKYEIFNINYEYPEDTTRIQALPTTSDILKFLKHLYVKAQMEPECIVMGLVYVERLLKCTESKMPLCSLNWQCILLSCFILANKVWDDLSMWNIDFSFICKPFTLKRINELEVALLVAMDFKVRISATSYAKYYFKLHTMRGDLGVASDVEGALNMEGAKLLEAISKTYEFKTVGDLCNPESPGYRKRSTTTWNDNSKKKTKTNASLEQIVTMGSKYIETSSSIGF